jgi:hypothetical protein
MSNPNYTLDIISHHPKFNAKALRKYYVDGIETVGAWGDEPFEIRFKNNTWQKVQIKLTVDGTDILTGKPADTEVSKDMWVVNGYDTISLKAWPEDNNGGAGFVFTSANNSVAVHTHGDLSSRGIIAAAVFTEGHVEPIKITPAPIVVHHHDHGCWPYCIHHTYPLYYNNNTILGGSGFANGSYSSSGGAGSSLGNSYNGSLSSNIIQQQSAFPAGAGSLQQQAGFNSNTAADGIFFGAVELGEVSCNAGETKSAGPIRSADNRRSRKSLEKLVSVGAGQHVDQKITYVTGLIKPTFAETIRVKYVWYDDLVKMLQEQDASSPQPSGFPADKKRGIDLGATPRIGGRQGSFRRAQDYARF